MNTWFLPYLVLVGQLYLAVGTLLLVWDFFTKSSAVMYKDIMDARSLSDYWTVLGILLLYLVGLTIFWPVVYWGAYMKRRQIRKDMLQ